MSSFMQSLVVVGFGFICYLGLDLLKHRNAKKCNYDCSLCKNWDCFAHDCAEKRKE